MITLKNVQKGYINPESGQYEVVLAANNLTFDANAHYAVSGPSGTGKTTLLHLLSGLIKPDVGSIIINGTDICSLSEAKRDRYRAINIGYIFQTFNLMDGYTALENVMMGMIFTGNGADKQKATAALESVGLGHRLHYMPSQLSVGQQQRVSVARAIVNDPPVLLADEPTGNLDPATTAEILRIIREQAKDKVLIVVSHEQDVLSQFENRIDLESLKPELQPN